MQAGSQQQQQKQSAEKKQTAQTFDDSDAGGVALCPHCGAELDDGADFCGDCGKPVTEKAAAQGSVAQATAAQAVRTVEAPAPAKPETAAIEETPVNVEPEPVVEEEPVRKSFFSGSQMSSIRQTGADIDSEQTQRAEEARIAEEERREAERIAEQKRLAQIVEEKRLTEESRREAERQAAQQAAEAQRIAAEQRQKAAAAQQAAAQQAEAERQRQIREAQAQEQARIAAATSAQVRQQTLQVPSEPINLVGTIWNCIEIETDEQYGSSDNVFHFKKRGVLKCPTICDGTWVQNGNSVTIEFDIGDACLTIELKIINAELMQGTSELTDDDEETNPVELRRKK